MTLKQLVGTYILLMLLLAVTAGLHLVDLGIWNLVLNLGIAAAKAVLIGLVFMQLWTEINLIRAFAVTGLVWLALLIILTLGDYLHRDHPQEFYGREPAAPGVERSLHASARS